jgi:hypothetical protein
MNAGFEGKSTDQFSIVQPIDGGVALAIDRTDVSIQNFSLQR